MMSCPDAVRTVFSNYVNGYGRAQRSQYWWWTAFLLLAGFCLGLLDNIFFPSFMEMQSTRMTLDGQEVEIDDMSGGGGPLSAIWSLATIVPSICVAIRRLHDTDRTGWWLLIGLIPLVGALILIFFFVQKGTDGPNRFGPDPLEGGPSGSGGGGNRYGAEQISDRSSERPSSIPSIGRDTDQ